MGRQSNLRYIKRGLKDAVKSGYMTAEDAANAYREVKGREAPAPGPWPYTLKEIVSFDGAMAKVRIYAKRHERWALLERQDR